MVVLCQNWPNRADRICKYATQLNAPDIAALNHCLSITNLVRWHRRFEQQLCQPPLQGHTHTPLTYKILHMSAHLFFAEVGVVGQQFQRKLRTVYVSYIEPQQNILEQNIAANGLLLTLALSIFHAATFDLTNGLC